MIGWLLGDALPWLIGLGGAVLAAVLARLGGARSGRLKAQRDTARQDIKTIKEIGDAIDGSRASGAGWHDRLREHSRHK